MPNVSILQKYDYDISAKTAILTVIHVSILQKYDYDVFSTVNNDQTYLFQFYRSTIMTNLG